MQNCSVTARATRAGLSYYTGNELCVEATRKVLAKFAGGNVELSKNDDTGIATLCLNRQEKKNAISGQMLLDLERAAIELETWRGGKGLLLFGANNTFSSGGDLAMSRDTATPELGFAISQFVQHVTMRLRSLPLICVAFVDGVALGGGAELAVAACDWRLMTRAAKIGFVHARMGLTPGWGGSVALRTLLGPSRALELLVSAQLVTSSEALDMGLASATVESMDQAQQWMLQRLQSIPLEVIHANKIACTSEDYQRQLDTELRIQAPLWGGQAKLDALARNIKHT